MSKALWFCEGCGYEKETEPCRFELYEHGPPWSEKNEPENPAMKSLCTLCANTIVGSYVPVPGERFRSEPDYLSIARHINQVLNVIIDNGVGIAVGGEKDAT
jgi:hypothetical protein